MMDESSDPAEEGSSEEGRGGISGGGSWLSGMELEGGRR
jgi:hypothetical protein